MMMTFMITTSLLYTRKKLLLPMDRIACGKKAHVCAILYMFTIFSSLCSMSIRHMDGWIGLQAQLISTNIKYIEHMRNNLEEIRNPIGTLPTEIKRKNTKRKTEFSCIQNDS